MVRRQTRPRATEICWKIGCVCGCVKITQAKKEKNLTPPQLCFARCACEEWRRKKCVCPRSLTLTLAYVCQTHALREAARKGDKTANPRTWAARCLCFAPFLARVDRLNACHLRRRRAGSPQTGRANPRASHSRTAPKASRVPPTQPPTRQPTLPMAPQPTLDRRLLAPPALGAATTRATVCSEATRSRTDSVICSP